MLETPARIEPARLTEPNAAIADVIVELTTAATALERALHPRTAAGLADLVRIMNTYYSNLIEGHDTRPRDIERALAGEFDVDEDRRNLQLEARAHVRVQTDIDRLASSDALPEAASTGFLRAVHRDFYADAPEAMLEIGSGSKRIVMRPGEWRARPEEDNVVGRHVPPSSERVADFMAYFEKRFRFAEMGRAGRILAIAGAHHRFNYIHPFPDGNGRVSRLMSHAMAASAGIGAHGLWSVSRGLARGLDSRGDYKRMMDHADAPRQGDRDGRGNLSEAALIDFTLWFLRVCLDQVTFMASLFDLDALAQRLRRHVDRNPRLRPEAFRLLEEALVRGEVERGDAARLTGLPERSARRVLADTLEAGLLGSDTPKGRVSLRFPAHALEDLFPRLYPQA